MRATVSYEEKNTWAFGVIAPIGYCFYLVLAYLTGDGPLDPVTFVWPMIWSIGGAILAGIVAGIVIGVVSGAGGAKHASRIDRRDQEIGWHGSRVGNSFIVIGGVSALVLCFVQSPHVYIANVLYACFVLAAILQSATKLVAYRRGF